jgi:hypothetical protein
LYNDLYRDWSVWYAQAARTMPVDSTGPQEEGAPYARLVVHLTMAYLRGLIELSDEASGIREAFRRARPVMLSHLYWQLFREFSDASDPPPDPVLARLESLWNWRVVELEAAAPGKEREEEAKGLSWFVVSDWVTPVRALVLGLRTIPMMGRETTTIHMIWDRVEAFAQEDPLSTMHLVAAMLQAHSQAPFPHVPVDKAKAACAALRPRVGETDWQQFVDGVAELARRGWAGVQAVLQ